MMFKCLQMSETVDCFAGGEQGASTVCESSPEEFEVKVSEMSR